MTLHWHDWLVIGWLALSLLAGLALGRAMACSPEREGDDQ